jgi:iron only hydrogenase large subunit-like protein
MASIDNDRCIYCGHCVKICPVNAKKVRDGVSRAKFILNSNEKVIVSIAPSYISEFPNTNYKQIIGALKDLGFYGVSETALGAEMVSVQTATFLKKAKPGYYISSACPVVVDLISKYYPQHTNKIIPYFSPMLAHAKLLKETYGENTKLVFVGPCIGKKLEADEHSDLIDVVISFKDLEKWLEKEKIELEDYEESENKMIPYRANKGSLYPIDGGMITGIKNRVSATDSKFMSFSGLKDIKEILDEIDNEDTQDVIFLELLACSGGCVNGPGSIKHSSIAKKRLNIINSLKCEQGEGIDKNIELDIRKVYISHPVKKPAKFSEKEVVSAMSMIGKLTSKDELNCGGCGYDSCRDFANAMLEGRAEKNMCVSYMRRVAQDKATVLLQKIPSGVVIVDQDLKVVELNIAFARMLGEDIESVFHTSPGMPGADLRKLTSLENHFSTALMTGKEINEMDVEDEDRLFQLSIFNVQPHKLVCGIIQNRLNPEVKKDLVVKRTREVIRQNMKTVQQVAYLLGENAAFTDSMLNSILDKGDNEDL